MKTSKHCISVSAVRKLRKTLQRINRYDFADLIFLLEDGTVYTPTPEQVEHWKFVGLNNVDFIEMELNEIS